MICQTNYVDLHTEFRSAWINRDDKFLSLDQTPYRIKPGHAPYICENINNTGLPSNHRGRGDEAVELDDSRLPSNHRGRGVCPFESFQRDLQEISEIPFLTRVEHEVEVLNKQSVSAAVPAEAAARSEEINSAIRAFEQIETTANDNPNDNQEPE